MKLFTRTPKIKLTASLIFFIAVGYFVGKKLNNTHLYVAIFSLIGLLVGVFWEGKRFG